MMECLEKRWKECDQVVYIISYVLDCRLALNGLSINNRFSLSTMLDKTYERLFHKESTTLAFEFASYLKLNKERDQFAEQPILFWDFGESMTELSALGRLPISISPQGADLERVFSASGIFHNALRNKLSHIKAEKMVRVKGDMLQRNPRRKRVSKSRWRS